MLQQLQVITGNEKAPDPKFIRGKPEHYIINKIIDKRINKNKEEYKVSWKGYTDSKDDSWIPSSELDRTEDLRQLKKAFNQSHR